jgi:putative inorganic carbon (HCO3(-)) transporter
LFRWLPFWARLGRYLPDTFNENVIAGTLVVLSPFAMARVLLGWRRGGRLGRVGWVASILLSMGMVFILILTASRGAYLALSVSLFVLLALSWPRALPVLILVGVAIAVLCVALLGWQRMANALLASGVIHTLDQRIEIWSRALYIIRDFPFTGLGMGCFQSVVARIYPLFLHPDGTVSHAHNLYLQVAVDLGIPGLVAFLAILGLSFHMALKAYRAFALAGERGWRMLSAACVAALVGMCVHGILDSAVWGNKGAFLPWIVLGLSAALHDFVGNGRAPAHEG